MVKWLQIKSREDWKRIENLLERAEKEKRSIFKVQSPKYKIQRMNYKWQKFKWNQWTSSLKGDKCSLTDLSNLWLSKRAKKKYKQYWIN